MAKGLKLDRAAEDRASATAGARALRVLVVGINYAPDYLGIAKYTTELCEELVKRGHAVEVVTAPPYYPAWVIPEGYRGRGWTTATLNGVSIHRTPLYVPRSPSGVTRLLHHLSFALAAAIPALQAARRGRPDVVLAIAPSLMSAPIAMAAAWIGKARSWLHIQDFEVDAAFQFGILRGEPAKRWAALTERWIFGRFDKVSTISGNMRQALVTKGVHADHALEVRNWVDIDAIRALPDSDTAYRAELGIPATSVLALYSGNMASKQGLEKLADMAAILEVEAPDVRVVLCGGGPLRRELERLCATRANVRFLDLQPIERLGELLATADIHLLPQRSEVEDLVLPSKLTGMLASGRPVVAMAHAGTALAHEMAGCGLAVEPGNAEAMARAVLTLASDLAARQAMGCEARRMAETRWRRSAIIDDLETRLRDLASAS